MKQQEINKWWQKAITKERERLITPSKPKPKKEPHAR